MIPAKAKDLIPEVAQQIGIPEEHLQSMVSFYFKEVKQVLVNLDHLHVRIKGFGTMNMRGWDLEDNIKNADRQLTVFTSPIARGNITAHKEVMERAKVKWDDEMRRKKEAGILKKQFYDNKTKEQQNDTQG
jgi:hypothetical protein